MRLALDLTDRSGRPTGIGVFAASLAEALAGLPGLEVIPLSPPWNRMTVPRRVLWEQVLLPLAARRAGAELLHHTGFAASRVAGLPRVLTVHDLLPLEHPDEFPGLAARSYWSRYLPSTLGAASLLVCDSAYTRSRVLAYRPGLAPRTLVVPLAAPLRPDRRPTAEVTSRLRLPLRFVLAVGSQLPRKDHRVLVEAFARLVQGGAHPDLALVLAGPDGPATPAIREAIRARRLEGRLVRLPWVEDRDLPGLYRAATVLAFPSRGEGFGLPPLEAMAEGTPVVAADATSVPEIVGDGAVRVPPGDPTALAEALARVLGDEDLRARLIARGRRRARAFAWSEVAQGYLRAYRRALGPG